MSGAVLDATAQTALPADREAVRSSRPLRACAECAGAYVPSQHGQLFCCHKCKRTYNNRWLKRGAVIAPLYVAARATRGGTRGDTVTGAKARRDAEHLAQRWKEEDAAAGRMSAIAYMAARYRLGLVEVA